MIRGVNKVVIAADDQERAKTFWTDLVGCTVLTDAEYGEDGRWLELLTPDGNTSLVLDQRSPDDPTRQPGPELPASNIFFYADDIQRTYRELSARGVEFPAPPIEQPWGWWAMFTDSEGNRYALGQRAPSRSAVD